MRNPKHAYMIIAHNEESILIKLVELLDNKNNDIYIHIDKKSKEIDTEKLKKRVKNSNIYFTKRLDVRWGSVSLTKCELLLLETAISKHNYQYYHLISGVDLPIKSQREIQSFFEKNNGYEFIHFVDKNEITPHIVERVKYYHFFINGFKSRFKKYALLCEKLHNLLLKFQKILKVNRIRREEKLAYGSQWFSITDSLARYLVRNKNKIIKRYRWTLCSDEMFLQSVVAQSEFINNVYKPEKKYTSNLRYIDFKRGNPYTFCEKDYEELVHTNNFFVRKLSTKTLAEKKLVNKIYESFKR